MKDVEKFESLRKLMAYNLRAEVDKWIMEKLAENMKKEPRLYQSLDRAYSRNRK